MFKGFGLKNQKLVSNLKQFSYSNVNNINNKSISKAAINNNTNKKLQFNNFCGSSLNLFSISCLQATKLMENVINFR